VKYDNLLKTIFFDAMPGMLRALKCAPVAEYLSVEFPSRPKMVADVIARLSDGKILHLEFQLTNDPRMHWRCFHYFGAIQEQWEDSEVVQVVIYLGNSPLQMRREIRTAGLHYTYEILDMRQIEADVFLDSPHDAERVLALLCGSADPRTTIRRILASWRHLSDKALLENVEHLRTLSQLRRFEIIATEEIDRMPFHLDITESLTYKIAQERILKTQLERAFGPLPDGLRKRIANASKEELEEWIGRVHGAPSLHDVFADPTPE
jgi:hypothetical protein